MRKTALLTGVAGLFLLSAPAFAQDGTAPQTPPAPPAAAEQTLSLSPGSDVKGSDGAVLGKLEGVRETPTGQELTVRGADGVVRGIPASGGVRQDGAGVAVGWTASQFSSAPAITAPGAEPAPAAPSEPAAPTEPTTAPSPDQPAPGEGQTQPDAPNS